MATASTKKRTRPYAHFLFPDEIAISIKKMIDSDCQWHNVPSGSYHVKCENYGWFPTQLIAGTIKGYFSQNTELSKHTGYLESTNLGTAGDAFAHIHNLIPLLESKGYILKIESDN